MDDVHLADYDPAWPALYDAEAERLTRALPPGLVLAVEHFGSTAIPGMIAKPVIDLLIAVRSIDEAREIAVKPMAALGYAFWADNPRRDRLFFVRGLPPAAPHRTHHVHMTQMDGEMWRRLWFRDYLRSHPDEAQRYADLKCRLAALYEHDREAYTAAKSAYVDSIMAQCPPTSF
jgi:GrpB-like predicted nucleotidyltransferase (UPF0157 family)